MFKTRKIVLVPTNERTNLILDKNKLEFIKNAQLANIINSSTKGFHLHVLSDDDNVENNWCLQFHKINTNIPINVVKYKYYGEGSYYFKKIIATTANLTNVETFNTGFIIGGSSNKIPQIPIEFVKHFIEQYNKGIVSESVEVEYESKVIGQCSYKCHSDSGISHAFPCCDPKVVTLLKLTNNTINIKQTKTSWSRGEVVELINDAINSCTSGTSSHNQDIDEWFSKNL